MGPSIWQLLLVALIIVLIFGAGRLRNLGGDLGAAIKGFRKAMRDDEDKTPQQDDDQDRPVIEGEVRRDNPQAETEVQQDTPPEQKKTMFGFAKEKDKA
ncbi:MAG: twin-arginine translocase TatA/TatE family subunit [Candidatus Competibacterales bacterium]